MIDLSIPGQMTRGELECLAQIAREVPENGVVVETGSLYGRSSYTLATSVPSGATVYCIDPWVREEWIISLVEKTTPGCPEFSFEAFESYTRDCRNIVPIRGYSPADAASWARPVDVFFDDSLHHNPFFRTNLRFWFRHVKPGGIICGHDYCKEWPDVALEVDRLAAEIDANVNVTEWVWWMRKPDNPSITRRLLGRFFPIGRRTKT